MGSTNLRNHCFESIFRPLLETEVYNKQHVKSLIPSPTEATTVKSIVLDLALLMGLGRWRRRSLLDLGG